MLERITRRDFEGLPDDALTIEVQGQRMALQVLELRDLPPISPRPEPFSLTLAGPASPLLPQGVYQLRHPRHGTLELFVVPISRSADQTRYEVIFN